MVAGLASSGVDVLRLGVVPTPAVAYLTRSRDADFGVVLSASHNPAPDNGIKFFARGGRKLPDAVEDRIEDLLDAGLPEQPPAAGFGRVIDARADQERYLDHLLLPWAVARTRPGRRCRACVSSSTARTEPPTRSRRRRCAAQAPRSSRSASTPTATTSTRAADRPAGGRVAAVLAQGADVGMANTAMRTGAWPSTPRARWWTRPDPRGPCHQPEGRKDRVAGDTVAVNVMSNLGFRLAMDDAGTT